MAQTASVTGKLTGICQRMAFLLREEQAAQQIRRVDPPARTRQHAAVNRDLIICSQRCSPACRDVLKVSRGVVRLMMPSTPIRSAFVISAEAPYGR